MAGVKRRKANFSDREISVLIDKVEDNYKILSAKFSDVITSQEKNKVWNDIAEAVNAVSTVQRTTDELKKKWEDLKTRTKKKASETKKEMGKTGGGEVEGDSALTETELRIIGIIGETLVYGLKDGMDTAEIIEVEHQSTSQRYNEESTSRANSETSPSVRSRSTSNSPWPPIALLDTDGRVIIPNVYDDDDSQKSPPPPKPKSNVSAINKEHVSKRSKLSEPPRSDDYAGQMLEVEKERLETEKARLEIEKKRLELEQARFNLEQERFALQFSGM